MTINRLIEMKHHEPNLTAAERADFEQIASRCGRGVRGCTTDEQYQELQERIVEALAFASSRIRPTVDRQT